jgi:hypothetical protein
MVYATARINNAKHTQIKWNRTNCTGENYASFIYLFSIRCLFNDIVNSLDCYH